MNESVSNLHYQIEELRKVLNEMSVYLTSGNQSNKLELLKVSEKLDLLIVEFTALTNIEEL